MERPKPGTFIDNLPEILYHNKDHGYSSSDLKSLLKKSPYHFRYDYNQPAKEPTEAMKLGSVLHCALLRPNELFAEIVVMPHFNLRKKEEKEKKARFIDDHKHLLAVKEEQFDLGMAMVEAVKKNDEAMELLEDSICERSFYGELLDTPFRARADSYKGNTLYELKSTKDANPMSFTKDIANLYYHVSLLHYAALMEQCLDHINDIAEIDYRFIVVENTPPHATAVYIPSERMIAVGFELFKKALHFLVESHENDYWPAYTPPGQPLEIDLPNWAVPREEEA